MAPRRNKARKSKGRRKGSRKSKSKGRRTISKRSTLPKPQSQRSLLRSLMKKIEESTEDTTVEIESSLLCDPDTRLERPVEWDLLALGDLAGRAYNQYFDELEASRAQAESIGSNSGNNEVNGHDAGSNDATRPSLKAPPPSIPRWDDDTEELAKVTYFAGVKRIKRIEQRDERMKIRQPPTFNTLPPEIKDRIFRELLLADDAIQVHGDWKFLYKGAKRNNLGLHASILGVSKAIFAQASRILYGENTFLYLLRDQESSAPGAGLGSDYEDEGTSRRHPRRRRAGHKKDIDFNKYSWLMRNIAVKAEHNRYSSATLPTMARVIRMLAYKPPSKRNPRERNIRTLTIKIAPQPIRASEPDADRKFTCVDLFEPESEVLLAIQSLECHSLHIELLNTNPSASGTGAPERSSRLVVDMRPLRVQAVSRQAALTDEPLVEDRSVIYHRMQRKEQSTRAIKQLAETIKEQCSRWTFPHTESEESDLEGGMDDDDLDEWEGQGAPDGF